MRIPSRNMPKYSFEESNNSAIMIVYIILIVILSIFLFTIYKEPLQGLFFIGVVLIISTISNKIEQRRLRKLALERKGEDIGSFARSFDFRKVDTWVIRAVYEELLEYMTFKDGVCPIRASDDLIKEIKTDYKLIDIFDIVLYRTNRSPDDMESNPYYDRVSTVKDLVLFLDYQPKLERVTVF